MAIKVLIIDDSALIRQLLREVLAQDAGIEVVGVAADPFAARTKIKELAPDVLTLDVEMPRMDGLTFLRNLMRLRPMPVVMFSSLTEKNADVTLEALELGAFDFVPKPKLDVAARVDEFQAEIVAKIHAAHAARHRVVRTPATVLADAGPAFSADAIMPSRVARHYRTTDRVIAIGASTGGTEAIREVVAALPPDAPGVVITQHIPPVFSTSFARRLDQCSAMTVVEAAEGMVVRPGHVFVAPGGRHLVVARDGARYVCHIDDGPPVNRHRPSVDVLFRSVANAAGPNAVGAILTGMGEDGARGLLEMQTAGAPTVAQDEATSVVWGMPGTAVRLGAAGLVLPLDRVAKALLDALKD